MGLDQLFGHVKGNGREAERRHDHCRSEPNNEWMLKDLEANLKWLIDVLWLRGSRFAIHSLI